MENGSNLVHCPDCFTNSFLFCFNGGFLEQSLIFLADFTCGGLLFFCIFIPVYRNSPIRLGIGLLFDVFSFSNQSRTRYGHPLGYFIAVVSFVDRISITFLTDCAERSSACFSSSVSGTSMTLSIPFPPRIVGTPR